MARLSIHWQILIAIALAVLAGSWRENATIAGVPLPGIFDFLGTLFISALKMLIVPLVCSSMIVGVRAWSRRQSRPAWPADGDVLPDHDDLGDCHGNGPGQRRSSRASSDGRPDRRASWRSAERNAARSAEEIADKGFGDMLDVFLSIVPTNVISAAAGDDMLGVIFFSMLFGYFMARLDHSYADPLFRFWTGVFQIMMRMTEWVMKFAPVGVFGLVAQVGRQDRAGCRRAADHVRGGRSGGAGGARA